MEVEEAVDLREITAREHRRLPRGKQTAPQLSLDAPWLAWHRHRWHI